MGSAAFILDSILSIVSSISSDVDFLIISTTGPFDPSEITLRSPGCSSEAAVFGSAVSFLSSSACFSPHSADRLRCRRPQFGSSGEILEVV